MATICHENASNVHSLPAIPVLTWGIVDVPTISIVRVHQLHSSSAYQMLKMTELTTDLGFTCHLHQQTSVGTDILLGISCIRAFPSRSLCTQCCSHQHHQHDHHAFRRKIPGKLTHRGHALSHTTKCRTVSALPAITIAIVVVPLPKVHIDEARLCLRLHIGCVVLDAHHVDHQAASETQETSVSG